MEVKLNVNLQDFFSNFQNSLFLVIKLRTPISFIIGMSTSLLGLKSQFAFGNAEICYFPFFHWRLEAKKFRFSLLHNFEYLWGSKWLSAEAEKWIRLFQFCSNINHKFQLLHTLLRCWSWNFFFFTSILVRGGQ